jgi:DNA-directed RNA polymerase subunit omega
MSVTYKLEELLVGKENRYQLVLIASKRARALSAGALPLIESETRKIPPLALEEVLRGKIVYGKTPALPSKKEEGIPVEKTGENEEKKIEK